MPRTFPQSPFRVRVHGTYRYAFSVGKAERTKNGDRTEEREKDVDEKEASMYVWQKIDASCALTPRGSFRVMWYRPVERSDGRSSYENTRKRSIRRLFIVFSFFFFKHLFLRVPSCACITCSISFARVFDYECLVLRHRARATFASVTAPLDREHRQLLRCILPCITFHTF